VRLLDQRTNDIQAALAREDRHPGLELEHGPFYFGGFVKGNVRRVADDEVEIVFICESFQDIALQETNATLELQARGIGAGDFQSLGGEIDSEYLCGLQFTRQCEGYAAGTSPYIDDSRSRDFARQLHYRFNQVFGLRARNEDGGRNDEVESPKLLVSGDVLCRESAGTPTDELLVALDLVGGQIALRMTVDVSAIHSEYEHQKRLGVQARRANVGRFKLLHGRRERLLQLHGEVMTARRARISNSDATCYAPMRCLAP